MNRKSVTISEFEFQEWKELKQRGESWTSLLRRIRTSWSDLRNFSNFVCKTPVKSGVPQRKAKVPIKQENTELKTSSKIFYNKAKRACLREIKNMVKNGSFSTHLKRMSKEELSSIQKSDEELELIELRSIGLHPPPPPPK